MKHLYLTQPGQFVGVTGNRLTVKEGKELLHEFALSRLKTIIVAKQGVSFSGNLIMQCAERGIRLFFLDFRGIPTACLNGTHAHGVARVRRNQFLFIDSPAARNVVARIVHGKIKNQRAVLKYFSKHSDNIASHHTGTLDLRCSSLRDAAENALSINLDADHWRQRLLGIEGQAARTYWDTLKDTELLPHPFEGRTGRAADDRFNQALNYGYAILSSFIWNAILNAGLEAYAGLYHVERDGRPSLVLDLMEEYRPWAVDRAIVKCRAFLLNRKTFDAAAKKRVIEEVQGTFSRKYYYKGRKLRLESILQRQIYQLAGCFCGSKSYRPYLFRW